MMFSKKLSLPLFFFFFSLLNLSAQTFPWAKSANGPGLDEGISVATDASGNVFITGQFTSSLVTFGTFSLTNAGSSTVFLAKYSAAGNVLWARKSISTGTDYGNCVTTDGSGNIFISGFFNSPTIIFGSFTLTNSGNYDLFIVKYDPNGNVLWAQSAGGNGNEYGYSAKADNTGNCYVAGSFGSPTIALGSTTLTMTGVCDSYLVKYAPNGTVLWAVNPSGTGGDENWSVCPDASGNVYVVGDFVSPTLTFGTITVTNTGICPMYLAKYDASNGNALWVRSAGGTLYDYSNWVTVDNAGDVIITGDFSSSSITFGTFTLTNNGINDAYIVKYSSAGNVLWARSAGNAGINKGYCVSADANNIYCTGSFTGSIVFGTSTLTAASTAPDPVYIVTYDYSGNVKCVNYLDSGSDDQQGICADKLGNAYFVSDFIGTLVVGTTTLLPTGGENIFLAKYQCADLNTSIPEKEKGGVMISPNPASGYVDIHIENEQSTLLIMNQVGEKVIEQKIEPGDKRVNIKTLAKGIYFYSVVSDQKVELGSGRLVVE